MTAPREESLRTPCPRCGELVTAPLRRASLRCGLGHAFEVALFSPVSPVGRSRPAALVASAQTPCARHARNAAVAACETLLRDWNRIALNVGLVSLCFFPFAPVGGPLAVVLWLRGRRQDKRTGEPLHPLLGVLGMIFGVVAFAVGVLFYMSLFKESGRGGIRA